MGKTIKNGFLGDEFLNSYHQIYKEYQPLFSLAERINNYCHEIIANKINVHSENIQEIIALLLFLRVSESFQGSVVLASRGMNSPASMIARCMIDPVCVLKIISENAAFANDYILSYERDRLNILKKFKKLGIETNIDEEIQQLKEKIKSQKIQKLESIKLLEDANLFRQYGSAFIVFSEYIHSTRNNLENEYLDINEHGVIKSIIAGPKDKNIPILLLSLITFIIDCLDSIGKIFSIDTIDTEKYKQELIKINEEF